MSGKFNEYVFCSYCGGVTPPGVCKNCGMTTHQEQMNQSHTYQTTNVQSNQYEQPGTQQGQYQQPYMQPNRYEQPGTQQGQYQQPYMQPNRYEQPGIQQGQYQQPYMQPNRYEQPGVQQGQYQQPYMQSNRYQQSNYQPPKKKSHWWIWLLIIAIVLILGLLLVGIFVVGAMIIVSDTGSSNIGSTGPETFEPATTEAIVSELEDEQEVYVYPRELGRLNFDNFDWEAHADSALNYSETTNGSKDPFLASDYSSTFGSNHDNHTKDEFTGDYYDPFVDCIDVSYDYGLARHYIEYSNVQDNMIVSAKIAYIQLEGGVVPNEEEINRKILEMTANDLFGHISGDKTNTVATESVTFMVDSFVTYNDEEKMSILLDVNVVTDDTYFADSYIYAINIDLVNGTIMDNGDIIEVDEDFAAMFREKCCTQNGYDIEGLNNIEDSELAELLADSDSNIVFFTPYGLEVGYSYEMQNGYESSRGWMTITLKDYEQYLKTKEKAESEE